MDIGIKFMPTWSAEELTKIGSAEELEIASVKVDGTLRKPVTIWVVSLGNYLYVRSVHGRTSAWFRGTLLRREGHLWAGGIEKDVSYVEENDLEINNRIDAVYRKKYQRYAASIINSIVSPDARSATIKLVPRSKGS
jgi:hypothetical protein